MHDSEHEAVDVEQPVFEQRLTRALDLLATTFETDADPVRAAVEPRAMSEIETIASEVAE
jgi:hypothetical protein